MSVSAMTSPVTRMEFSNVLMFAQVGSAGGWRRNAGAGLEVRPECAEGGEAVKLHFLLRAPGADAPRIHRPRIGRLRESIALCYVRSDVNGQNGGLGRWLASIGQSGGRRGGIGRR